MVAGLAKEALKESLKTDPLEAAQQMLARPSASLAGKTVEEEIKALVGKLGENMVLSRALSLDAGASGCVGTYMHADGKLATLVALQASKPAALLGEAGSQLARDLAMQVAGANPPALVVSRDQVPADFIAHEREIALAQAKATGKPENILTKIAEGKVNKVLQEITLLEQAFVKEPDVLIRDLIKREGAKAGDTLIVAGFKRLRVGEKDKEN
jgi:elongation factor Ts